MPLLLQDEPIEKSTKDVLNKIAQQLEEVATLITEYPKLNNNFINSILNVINPILQDKEKSIFKLETFFNTKYSYEKFSVIASLVDLNKEEIGQLEKTYNYPYYKKLQINSKDANIYTVLLDHIKYRDEEKSGTYELLQQSKEVYSILIRKEKDVKPLFNLLNARLKTLDLQESKWSDFNNLVHSVYVEQAIELENVNSNKKKALDLNYFAKLFKLDPINLDNLKEIEEVKKGLAISNMSFTKEYGNIVTVNKKSSVYNLHEFKQVSALEFSQWGGKVYEQQIKDYYFFTTNYTAIAIPKKSAIVDTQASMKSQSSKYDNNSTGKYVSPQENNHNNLQLNYEGMKNIRLAMFEDVPKWQPGSFIKINEDMIYVLRTPYPQSYNNSSTISDKFSVECIYLSMSNNDYYHKKIELSKSNIENSRKLDATERLMFFQFLDSCYQSEVQSRNYVMVEKKLRY